MADQPQDLNEYLAQLENQRAVLTIQIAGIRQALGMGPDMGATGATGAAGAFVAALQAQQGASGPMGPTGPSGPVGGAAGAIRKDQFFRMSMPEAIQAFLAIMKQPQTPKVIADGLKAGGILSESSHFYASVFTSLKRLRAQGLVVNTKTGGWGLTEWYAGRAGASLPDKPKKKRKVPKAGKASKGAAKKAAAPSLFPENPEKAVKGAFQAFMGEQMAAGKSMKEAAAAWREHKGSHDHDS